MVKHISLIIGCVILSLSAAFIVPTSCSPIGENEQKEIHLTESRSKRQTAEAFANSASNAQATNQLRAVLAPYLLASNPALKMALSGGSASDPNGLSGLLANLNPTLAGLLAPLITFLSKTVGGLGTTLDKSLTGVGGDLGLGFLDPVTGGLGDILAAILGRLGGGGGGGGGGIPPKPMIPMMPIIPKIPKSPYTDILALLASIKTSASSSAASSSSSSSSTTTTETKIPLKTG